MQQQVGRQENSEIQRGGMQLFWIATVVTGTRPTKQYWQKVGMPPFGDVTPGRVGNASDTDADHSSPDQTKTPPPKKKKQTKD